MYLVDGVLVKKKILKFYVFSQNVFNTIFKPCEKLKKAKISKLSSQKLSSEILFLNEQSCALALNSSPECI